MLRNDLPLARTHPYIRDGKCWTGIPEHKLEDNSFIVFFSRGNNWGGFTRSKVKF